MCWKSQGASSAKYSPPMGRAPAISGTTTIEDTSSELRVKTSRAMARQLCGGRGGAGGWVWDGVRPPGGGLEGKGRRRRHRLD
jgi:hypothetical protein